MYWGWIIGITVGAWVAVGGVVLYDIIKEELRIQKLTKEDNDG